MWARLPIRLIVMTIKMVILPVVIYILSKRVFYKYNIYNYSNDNRMFNIFRNANCIKR